MTAGGSIQTAGRTAGLARKLVAKLDQSKILALLEEAIYDPEVFRTLTSRNTAKGDLVKATKLRGFMLDLNNDLTVEDGILRINTIILFKNLIDESIEKLTKHPERIKNLK